MDKEQIAHEIAMLCIKTEWDELRKQDDKNKSVETLTFRYECYKDVVLQKLTETEPSPDASLN